MLLVLFSMTSLLANGQAYRCLQYNNKQGLQNNLTKATAIDKFGFLWVATDNGLAKFDGISFQQFSLGLPSTYVKSIFKTKKGKLVASTDMGVIQINSNGDSTFFTTIVKGSQNVTDSTVHFPKLIYEDSKENLWITDDMGMCKLKDGKFKRYTFDKKLTTYTYYRTFSMVENANGTIYVFSQNGYTFYFDEKKDMFVEMPDIPKFTGVSYALMAEDGQILVCESNGIYELSIGFNNKKKSLELVIPKIAASHIAVAPNKEVYASTWTNGLYKLKKQNGKWDAEKLSKFPLERTNYLTADDRNNVFVCTDAGIIMLKDNFFQMPVNISSQSYINTIGITPQNSCMFADGGIVYKIKTETNASSVEIVKPTIKVRGEITIVAPSKSNTDSYWVTSSTSEVYYINKGQIANRLDLSQLGRTIFYGTEDSYGNFWACMDGVNGVVKITKKFEVEVIDKKKGLNSRLFVIRQNDKGRIFGGGTGDSTYLFEYLPESDRFVNRSIKMPFTHNKDIGINDICFENEKLWMASSQGVLKYDGHKIDQLQTGYYTDNMVRSITVDQRGSLWYAIDKGIIQYVKGTAIMFNEDNGLSTITAAYRCMAIDKNNHLWIGTSLGLNFAKNDIQTSQTKQPVLSNLQIGKHRISLSTNNIEFIKDSYLTVGFICLEYPSNEVSYQYKLDEKEDKWEDLYSKTELILPSLPIGSHVLEIRAKQQGNFLWSQPTVIKFRVLRPWYQMWWAYLLYIILGALILRWTVRYNIRRYRSANIRLERMVQARTRELESTNTDLKQKNEEILTQRDEIEEQKNDIEKKSKHITSSIQYAQRIQNAVLSSNEAIERLLPDHFILFKPRDIVSGDFYFMKEINGRLIIAAADCTGHGVPGGFMSILGTTLLNEIVHSGSTQDAADILNQLRQRIKTSLQQTGKRGQQQDGMDIALCCIDLKNLEMDFAGANTPLYIYRKNKDQNNFNFNEIRGNRMPIGIHPHDNNSFTNHQVKLERGDLIYLFSDGISSQFGGEKGHKFKSKKLQEMLSMYTDYPMEIQKANIEKSLKDWMGFYDQVDDILMIGIRI